MKARQIQKQLSIRQLHTLIAGLGEYAAAEVLSDELGTTVTRSTARTLLRKVAQVAVDVTPDPGETEESIEDWLERQERQCARKVAKAKLHHRTFELPARPFALWVIGDPHLDNEGCDVATLRHELSVYQDMTDAYAICVGDMSDNWVGRLQKLYGSSNNTAHMGFRASQWLMEQASPFLALVGGNHDAWSTAPGHDPLKWLTREADVMAYAPDEIRLTLTWRDRPDLEPLQAVVRHDFPGRSWFHPTHGPHKEAMMDDASIYVAGHLHTWGELTTEQRHGRVTHALRVRGYKRADVYAKRLGFYEQAHGCSCLIVIDPESAGAGRVHVSWDIEAGARYLQALQVSD